jgi:hypothetical protein
MRPYMLAAALALAACAPTPATKNCHTSTQADGVDANGNLHYPEVCTASTTPARVVTPPAAPPPATDPVSQALARLRPDAPDPCREYTREQCEQGTSCDETVREVNKIATHKRAYSQCVSMLKREASR